MKTFYNTPSYFINGQHRITISLIGCGGTGSLILTRLARLHNALNQLGHPGLFVKAYDDDRVEEFNVGRQMFSPYDVGEFKSCVLIERINQTFGLDWQGLNEKYPIKIADPFDAHSLSNIIISAVDNVQTRNELKGLFHDLKENKKRFKPTTKPYLWLDSGNAKTKGQYVLSTICNDENDLELPDIIDLFGNLEMHDTKDIQGVSCSYRESLEQQDLFINDAIALYCCDLLWKLFRDKRICYHGGFINTQSVQNNPITIKPSVNV